MNCKPNSWATVIKPCPLHVNCSAKLVGVPVKVTTLQPMDSIAAILRDMLCGPTWMLADTRPCPHGHADCTGVDRLPDACLRPFDPGSAPAPEEEPLDLQALPQQPETAHG